MDDEPGAADRHVQRAGTAALIGIAAEAAGGIEVHRLADAGAGNAPVLDVDDAADRRGTEQQRRRTADDLDPLGQQRVDGDGMIDRGVGDVEAADAVGEHPHPLGIEAPQDRPRGVGAEEGR